MSKSILSNEPKCYFCETPLNLHRHHVYGGVSNRKQSERYGCWVWLCANHHNMSDHGVHFDKHLDLILKRAAQTEFEKTHSREEFILIFGRNYL